MKKWRIIYVQAFYPSSVDTEGYPLIACKKKSFIPEDSIDSTLLLLLLPHKTLIKMHASGGSVDSLLWKNNCGNISTQNKGTRSSFWSAKMSMIHRYRWFHVYFCVDALIWGCTETRFRLTNRLLIWFWCCRHSPVKTLAVAMRPYKFSSQKTRNWSFN